MKKEAFFITKTIKKYYKIKLYKGDKVAYKKILKAYHINTTN